MILPFLKKFEPLKPPPALVGVERRAAIRHETEIEATLSSLGRDYPCTIRSISTRGMTIAARDVTLCAGVQVIVRAASGPALTGTVRWLRDGALGVQFLQPLALDQIQNMRSQVPEGMKPRAGRARVSMAAMARFGNQTRRIEVLNLSVGGLQMSSVLPPREGQPVMIEFPDLLPIGGHIRWSRAGRSGVMFSKLLPLRVAEELAGRGGLPIGWLEEVRMVHELAQAA